MGFGGSFQAGAGQKETIPPPWNVKLRDRAVRIVRELTGADYDRAKAALEQTGWVVKGAVTFIGRMIAHQK